MSNTLNYILQIIPVMAALIIYFVRLEIKLAVMARDIVWIKKNIESCRPTLEKSS